MIVNLEQSYLASDISVIFKNPGLVRDGHTALMTPNVTKEVDRLDYYTPAQLANARGIEDRTNIIVRVLWGFCKYLLFIGLGWPVMPLMLTMQYITAQNYLTTTIPLNL